MLRTRTLLLLDNLISDLQSIWIQSCNDIILTDPDKLYLKVNKYIDDFNSKLKEED